ncbi:MAG: DUF7674 family protein, partial [Tumebacillaceae bacterium]
MEPELTKDNFISELLRCLPEMKPFYEAELAGWDEGEEPGLHNFFCEFYYNYWLELMTKNERKEDIQRLFAFIHRMTTSPDERVLNVAAVSFVENLGDDPALLQTAYTYMSPEVRELSDEMER